MARLMEKFGWRGAAVEDDFEDEYYEDSFEPEPVAPVVPKLTAISTPEIVSRREQSQDLTRIVTVHPTTYGDARIIGEAYREGVPVIVNISETGEKDARRIVDFSAGLVFALEGSIEYVTDRVLLLSPRNVKVEDERTKSLRSTF